jgi:hypothetical protein
MALLSMFLLPSDFRAGSQFAHGHSLFQLWADASDGHLDHHHEDGGPLATAGDAASWFDARVDGDAGARSLHTAQRSPDLPGHDDSTPAASGLHLLLIAWAILPVVAISRRPPIDGERRLFGRMPRIPLPPPRWTPASA